MYHLTIVKKYQKKLPRNDADDLVLLTGELGGDALANSLFFMHIFRNKCCFFEIDLRALPDHIESHELHHQIQNYLKATLLFLVHF